MTPVQNATGLAPLGGGALNAKALLTVSFHRVGLEDWVTYKMTNSAQDNIIRKAHISDQMSYPREWGIYKQSQPNIEIPEGHMSVEKVPGIGGNTDALMLLGEKGIVTVEALSQLDERSAVMLHTQNGKAWVETAKLVLMSAAKDEPKAEAKPTLMAPVAAQQQNNHNQNRRAS